MKEIVSVSENRKSKKIINGLLLHFAVAIMAFMASKGCVANKICPFGIGFCAGVPSTYAATAAVGAIIGYIFPKSGIGFVYIAACFAVCAVKLLLVGTKTAYKSPLVVGAVALVCTVAVNMVTFGFSVAFATRWFFEAVLAGICAFATTKSANIITRIVSGLRLREICCLIITLNAVFMGAFFVKYDLINIGCIIYAAVICAAAYFSSLQGGAVAGICGGVAYMLTYPDDILPLACFAAAGLLCGALFIYGKIPGVLGFAFAASALAVLGGITHNNIAHLTEMCFGAALFLVVPKSLLQKAGRLFSPPVNTSSVDGMCQSLAIRLNCASNALTEVCESVETLSKKQARQLMPCFETVINNTMKEACNGCLMKTRCWQVLRSETVDSIIELAHFTRKGEKPKLSQKTVEFGGRCNRMEAVMEVVNRNYNEYLNALSANSVNERVRKAISGQFSGVSRMLTDLSELYCQSNRFDVAMAKAVAASLYDMGLISCGCSCRADANGRINLEIEAKAEEGLVINRLQLNKILNAVCHREFAVPTITRNKEKILITAFEPPAFELQLGIAQSSCESAACGDSYEVFCDGRGSQILMLSDGMGHGTAAAEDSHLAAGMMQRLICAGFGYECSLDIVNSSMIYKSIDESLATVDIAAVDLFCGKVNLYKAGAAPTVVRKGGNICKAQSTSFPVGILDNAQFDCAEVTLKAGDILLVMSDGACCMGTEWISNLIKEWENGSAQELAEKIVNTARERRDDGHSDDITVLAAILCSTANS